MNMIAELTKKRDAKAAQQQNLLAQANQCSGFVIALTETIQMLEAAAQQEQVEALQCKDPTDGERQD